MDRIKASTGAALIGTGPLIGAIMGHLFIKSEAFSKKSIFSFMLGLIGVTLVSLGGGHNGGLPGSREIIGILMLLTSSIAGALSNVVVLKYKSDIKSSVLTSAQLIVGGVSLLILSLFIYDDITFQLPIKFYFSLGWLIFISAAGFSMWYHLLSTRKESLISMNIWKFIIPVSGGILGWILIPNDSPNLQSIFGMGLVASSILFFYKKGVKI
ncbi:MAG: hypothetical protein B6229_01940 [Spirochaetaceae bacterium 4572_7]|nr:MAG: hypothetical protein B6229_01940 [Spirochaetaceae bacterium 4572_7]